MWCFHKLSIYNLVHLFCIKLGSTLQQTCLKNSTTSTEKSVLINVFLSHIWQYQHLKDVLQGLMPEPQCIVNSLGGQREQEVCFSPLRMTMYHQTEHVITSSYQQKHTLKNEPKKPTWHSKPTFHVYRETCTFILQFDIYSRILRLTDDR